MALQSVPVRLPDFPRSRQPDDLLQVAGNYYLIILKRDITFLMEQDDFTKEN